MNVVGDILRRLGARTPAVFLDYDGTLTPIVEHPADAVMPTGTRESLERLAHHYPVAVISGRDLGDLRKRVGVTDIVYAGSHGFDIAGPRNLRMQHEEARRALPALDEAEAVLRGALTAIDGVEIERKRFAVAVHYRNVAPDDVAAATEAAEKVVVERDDLRRVDGKKVVELLPDVDWNKGRALLWLLHRLGLDGPRVAPIYIGDDLTDEDAFAALGDDGVGVFVDEDDGDHHTAAAYRLSGPAEVKRLLDALAERRERGGSHHSPRTVAEGS